MKRIFISILLFMVFSLSAQQAILVQISGKVEVRRDGDTQWIPAEENMEVTLSDTVSTGFGASATVVMGENRVILKPLSRLTLDMYLKTENSVSASLFLQVGAVKAEVDSSSDIKQNFQVQSPFSTASVRGTIFDFDGKRLSVTEGRVALFVGKPTRVVQKSIIRQQTEEGVEVTPESVEQAFQQMLQQVDEDEAVYVNTGEAVEIIIPETSSSEEEGDVLSAEEELRKRSVVTTDTSQSRSTSEKKQESKKEEKTDVIIIWDSE